MPQQSTMRGMPLPMSGISSSIGVKALVFVLPAATAFVLLVALALVLPAVVVVALVLPAVAMVTVVLGVVLLLAQHCVGDGGSE